MIIQFSWLIKTGPCYGWKSKEILLILISPRQTEVNNAFSAPDDRFLSKLSLCFYFLIHMFIRRRVSLQVTSCVLPNQLWRSIRSYLNTVLALLLIWIRKNQKSKHSGQQTYRTWNSERFSVLSSHRILFVLFSLSTNNQTPVPLKLADLSSKWLSELYLGLSRYYLYLYVRKVCKHSHLYFGL